MSIRIRTFQHLFFLSSALELANIAAEEEARHLASLKKMESRHQSCVVGAVTCSVSFLEAAINTLYEDSRVPWRNAKFRTYLAELWEQGVEKQGIFTKYQIALGLCKRNLFDPGAEPYQSAEALISIRNTIAHPKDSLGSKEHKGKSKLERSLTGRFKFNKPRHVGVDVDFFPDRCLSTECAYWAVRTAGKFWINFVDRLPPTAYLFPTKAHVDAIAKEAEESKTAIL